MQNYWDKALKLSELPLSLHDDQAKLKLLNALIAIHASYSWKKNPKLEQHANHLHSGSRSLEPGHAEHSSLSPIKAPKRRLSQMFVSLFSKKEICL